MIYKVYQVGDVIERMSPSDEPQEPPLDAVIVDSDGDAWKRYVSGWVWAGNDEFESWDSVLAYGRLTIVWLP